MLSLEIQSLSVEITWEGQKIMPTQRKDLRTVDMKTGEVAEGLLVWTPQKSRSIFSKEGFVTMSQEAMMSIVKAGLGYEAVQVFLAVVGRLDMENWINLNQSALAGEIGMKRENLNRAIKKLIAEGVLLAGPKVGHNCTYRLNPHYGWKGSTRNHVIALSDHMKNRMDVARISGVVSGTKERETLERAE
jgi:hypothetical protein